MKMTKKKVLIALCIFVVLVGIGFGIRTVVVSQREAAQEREIRIAYAEVNRAFRLVVGFFSLNHEPTLNYMGRYRSLSEADPGENEFGIAPYIYLLLLMYEIETGNVLPYEMVVDYFSQEFEPDGSLRLHNNGKHPEINTFVEWMWEGHRWRIYGEFDRFRNRVGDTLFLYRRANPEFDGDRFRHARDLSPQMLRELVRVASDPDLVYSDLNLTELQQETG